MITLPLCTEIWMSLYSCIQVRRCVYVCARARCTYAPVQTVIVAYLIYVSKISHCWPLQPYCHCPHSHICVVQIIVSRLRFILFDYMHIPFFLSFLIANTEPLLRNWTSNIFVLWRECKDNLRLRLISEGNVKTWDR